MQKVVLSVFVVFFLVCTQVNAGFYKWIDQDGNVHYGNQPPVMDKVQEIDGKSGFVKQLAPVTAPDEESVVKKVSNPTPVSAKTIAKQKLALEDLMCHTAIKESKEALVIMLESARKNLENGYTTKDQYNSDDQKFSELRKSLTVANCKASKGIDRKFYECLSTKYGDVALCEKFVAKFNQENQK